MSWRNFIALLGTAVALFSIAARSQQTAPPVELKATLERMAFTANGTSFAIFMPREAVIINTTGGQKLTFDLTKGGRLERKLIVGKPGSAPSIGYDRRKTWKNGNELAYRVEDDTGGGSGGPVAELAGQLKIGSVFLSFTCTDQDEGVRESHWYLVYLSNLEITKQGL